MFRAIIIVLSLSWGMAGAVISAAPFRLPLQSIGQVNDLQRAVDRLVATGYKLLANKPDSDQHAREFILFKNHSSPVYRYTEARVVHADDSPAARYALLSEGYMEHDGKISVNEMISSYVPVEKEREAIPPSTQEGYQSIRAVRAANLMHDHAYELIQSLSAEDGTYLLSDGNGVVTMHMVNDYRVYQNKSVDEKQKQTTTNRLTINGQNPYIVYRHTLVKEGVEEESGKVISEVLSEGRYPSPAVNDYAVEVFSAEVQGYVPIYQGSYKFYQDDKPRLETYQNDNPRLEQEDMPLTLVRDTKTWNAYDDSFRLGAGVEKWKARDWFNGYTQDDLVLHEVSSSAIERIGYKERTRELWVLFNESGDHHSYQYLGVPVRVFNRFLAAKSKGKYYNQYVKGEYRSVKY